MAKVIHLGNYLPIHYESNKLGDELAKKQFQEEFSTHTEIVISQDSTLNQAISEIKTIWALHSHQASPTYIAYNSEAETLAKVLSDEFGSVSIREI